MLEHPNNSKQKNETDVEWRLETKKTSSILCLVDNDVTKRRSLHTMLKCI